MVRILFVVMLAFMCGICSAANTENSEALISKVKGSVTVSRQAQDFPAKAGMKLAIGDRVATGKASCAEIILGKSAIVRMKPGTVFTVPQSDGNTPRKISFIRMLIGMLWVYAEKDRNSLKIATPNAICGVRGTEFVLGVQEDQVNLCVGNGSVAFVPVVEGMLPKAFLVNQGEQISFNAMQMMEQIESRAESAAKKAENRLRQMGEDMESSLESWGKETGKKLIEKGQRLEQKAEAFGRRLSEKALGWAIRAEERLTHMVPDTFEKAVTRSLSEDLYECWLDYDFSDVGISGGSNPEEVDSRCREFDSLFE